MALESSCGTRRLNFAWVEPPMSASLKPCCVDYRLASSFVDGCSLIFPHGSLPFSSARSSRVLLCALGKLLSISTGLLCCTKSQSSLPLLALSDTSANEWRKCTAELKSLLGTYLVAKIDLFHIGTQSTPFARLVSHGCATRQNSSYTGMPVKPFIIHLEQSSRFT